MARRSRKGKALARLSIRAFAKQLNVSHTAVAKAITSGRLRESIGRENGRPFIRDPALAEKEWRAGATKPGPAETSSSGAPSAPDAAGPLPGLPATLTQAQLRVAIQRERQIELDVEVKRGRLVDAMEAKRDAFRAARTVRDAVLNVPERLAADLAATNDVDRVHSMLTAELRKALEDAAAIIEAFESEVDAAGGDDE